MPAVALVRVVVFDQKLYHANGLVGRWCTKITTRFTAEAKRYAPARTGALRAGIFGESHQVGVRQVQGIIESTAPYSIFVLGGTTGPIMTDAAWANPGGAFKTRLIYKPSDGKWTFTPIPSVEGVSIQVAQKGYFMRLKPWGAHGAMVRSDIYRLSVAGQAANNFLLKAWRATGRDHTAIRGIGAPSTIRSF